MIPLRIIMTGDDAFKDDIAGYDRAPGTAAGQKLWQSGDLDAITMLEGGMQSGKPSVAVLVKCEDDSIVIAQTSWALLHAAVRAFEARYGAPE